jgi:hypothetical protein
MDTVYVVCYKGTTPIQPGPQGKQMPSPPSLAHTRCPLPWLSPRSYANGPRIGPAAPPRPPQR